MLEQDFYEEIFVNKAKEDGLENRIKTNKLPSVFKKLGQNLTQAKMNEIVLLLEEKTNQIEYLSYEFFEGIVAWHKGNLEDEHEIV